MIKADIKNIISVLKKNKLFSFIKNEELYELAVDNCFEKSFKKGSKISLNFSEEKCIGIAVKGDIQIRNKNIVLMQLREYDTFGLAYVYSLNECTSIEAVAVSECKAVFINKSGIDKLILKSPRFAKKYIEQLSEEINLLNERIEAYTSPNSVEKLYSYLCMLLSNPNLEQNIKMTELSKQLNISRASLYRAFEELESSGKITRDGKNIKIL